MRNPVQYPITKDEMIRTLEALKEESLRDRQGNIIIGGMRGAVLNEVIKIVKASDDA